MSFVKLWNSAAEPDKITEFHKSPIRRCCNHQTQSYKGYIWMYEKEYLEYIKLNESEEEI